jgi:hypothetical protein
MSMRFADELASPHPGAGLIGKPHFDGIKSYPALEVG